MTFKSCKERRETVEAVTFTNKWYATGYYKIY
jgi:hypothetical protein